MRDPSRIFFIRVLIPFMRVLPSRPNHLPEALLPNTIILGIRISTYEFWEDANIQSLASTKLAALISIYVASNSDTMLDLVGKC